MRHITTTGVHRRSGKYEVTVSANDFAEAVDNAIGCVANFDFDFDVKAFEVDDIEVIRIFT